METNIDCMKYRKSTHLAAVDVEAIIAEKGSCELTIELAFYDKGVDVSGNKTDAYFLKFNDPVKDMVVNSGNRKKIAAIIKDKYKLTAVESRNISNWAGLTIGLKVDPNVKMMGKVVGGIIIDTDYHATPKNTLKEAEKAFAEVNSRESFVKAMTDYNEFMQNADILATCKDLATKYPNPNPKK